MRLFSVSFDFKFFYIALYLESSIQHKPDFPTSNNSNVAVVFSYHAMLLYSAVTFCSHTTSPHLTPFLIVHIVLMGYFVSDEYHI